MPGSKGFSGKGEEIGALVVLDSSVHMQLLVWGNMSLILDDNDSLD